MRLYKSNHITSTFVNWLSKLFTISMQIVMIPLFFKYLGIGDYALFNFLIGLSGWFALCDLSSGVVLQNRISKNIVNNVSDNQLVAYSFYFYILLITFFLIVTIAIGPLIYHYFVLNITNISLQYFMYVWSVFTLIYLCNAIFQNTLKVYYAFDKSFQINLLNLCASVIGYLLLFTILHLHLPNPLILCIGVGVLPNVLINIAYYFKLIDRDLQLNWRDFIKFACGAIRDSKHFILVAINGALILQLDYFFIAYFLDAKDIIQYNLYAKMFSSAFAFYLIVLSNFYPVCTRALYAKDAKKALKGIILNISLGMGLIIICFIFAVFFKQIFFTYFFHGQVPLSAKLALLFGIYYMVRVWTDTWALPFFGMNKASLLFKYGLFQMLLSVALQYFLVLHYGIFGLMLGLIIAFLLSVFWIFPIKSLQLIKGGV